MIYLKYLLGDKIFHLLFDQKVFNIKYIAAIKIYKKAYLEFKKGEENIKKFAFKNVSIIQGTKDKTVLYDNIKDFCLKNNLELTTIDNGKHELYGYDDEIVRFLLKNINK